MENLNIGDKVVTPSGTGFVKELGPTEDLLRNEVLVEIDGHPTAPVPEGLKAIFLAGQLQPVK